MGGVKVKSLPSTRRTGTGAVQCTLDCQTSRRESVCVSEGEGGDEGKCVSRVLNYVGIAAAARE